MSEPMTQNQEALAERREKEDFMLPSVTADAAPRESSMAEEASRYVAPPDSQSDYFKMIELAADGFDQQGQEVVAGILRGCIEHFKQQTAKIQQLQAALEAKGHFDV